MKKTIQNLAGTCVAAALAVLVHGPIAAQGLQPPASRALELQAPASDTDAAPIEKSYLIPALEIAGFDFLLNRYNKRYSGIPDYDVSFQTLRRNLRRSWGVDDDAFNINQLGHPYQGSMYHGFGRSAGLNFWESAGLTFAGSIAWELAGENTRPSTNDQIASGVGGVFLGEALFRMASLVLEHGHGVPSALRETAAAVISPSTGFNRLVYGKRFDSIFASRNPDYYGRLQVGLMGTAQNRQGLSTLIERNEAQANFAIEYGLPGKDGYDYRRPFDYFTFEVNGSSANAFESVLTRGLLAGRKYDAGKNYRGIWGLYGSYDYISPQTFRISSTALSLGTTGQWRASDKIVVQGTAMAGVGYAALGSVNSSASERDYHYGVAPQALLALRVIHGDRVSFDVTGREYFVTGNENRIGGRDNLARVDVGLTWRLQKQHGVTVKYLWNRRHATFDGRDTLNQTRGTVGVFYTWLGNDGFGKVDWN